MAVGDIISITEFFVITSGANVRQVRAIADAVESAIKEAGGGAPKTIEGLKDAAWVLMDYGPFVVHIFVEETRAFYALDRLWADAPVIAWEEPAATA